MIKLRLQKDKVVGDGITDDNTLASSGKAFPQSVMNLFDGDSQFGSAEAGSAGVWTFTTDPLGDGSNSFTAAATDLSDSISAASAPVVMAVGTAAQSPLTVNTAPAITITDGGTVGIDGPSAQSVAFAGSTGTLKLEDAVAFTGQVSGLTGSDALDLADVSYGANTTAAFSGNAEGGTLTITDGTDTAHIALLGNYLTSGWTLSSDGHGGTVVVDPPLTGSVFPSAANTGISAGTQLTPATSNTISAPGVYNGLIFTGTVTITSSNVTLENCEILGTPSDGFELAVTGNLSNVVIQNDEISGAGNSTTQTGVYGIYIENDSQVTINAVNIHDVGVGVDVSAGQVIVENSYIHNFGSGSGTHYNGVAYFGGGGSDFSLLIQNNSIINQLTQTDAVILQNYFGPINNVTVTNNLLYGGDYPIYVEGEYSGGPVTNVSVTNNDLGLGPGSFGYTDFNQTNPTFTGNVDDGAALAATLPVSPIVSLASATAGNYSTGNKLTLTVYTSEVVTVSGTPTLTLNDGGAATYTGGSGTNALTFSYTVAAGQDTPALAVTGINGTIEDLDGNALSTSSLPATFTGVAVATGPTLNSIMESPSSGNLVAGKSVTLTLTMSEVVTVTGGPLTLALNDGGTATYTSGSGTNALVFSYTVSSSNSDTPSLAVTGINLNGATVQDGSGNAASFPLIGLTQTGPSIDTAAPTVSSVTESPSSGDLNAGKTVSYTLTMNEAVTVNTAGGSPTLILNDGGTATYTGGSGTNALTFSYTVLAGQNTPDLMVTAVSLNGATMQDATGYAANLSLSSITQGSPQVDTTAPAAPVISGDTVNVNTVTLTGTAEANSTITVYDNSTQLGSATTNGSGAWTFTSGTLANGSQSFTASATDGAGNVSPLSSAFVMTLTAPVNLVVNGNFASDSFSGWTLGGNYTSTSYGPEIYIDTKAQSSSTYAASIGSVGSDGTLSQTIATTAGQQYTLNFWLQNEGSGPNDFAAMWNGQTLLSLTNATAYGYTEYTYTVVATGSSSVLEFSARQDPSQWDLDNVSLSPVNTGPTVSAVAESPSSGDLNAGKTVTLTLNMSGNVTVNTTGGTPTLTLNDGGTATYSGGTGSSALTFSYTVGAGQNTAGLAATAVNLNGGTITDGSGNAASFSLTGLTQTGPQIDTTTPSVSSVTTSGTGITAGAGDLGVGKTVTFTVAMSEAVTVNTSGGTPTLSLNDGGSATYVSGTGTNALTFSYTVAAGQNTADLAVTAVNLNSATAADGAGNAANLTGAVTNPAGTLQIDTTTPTVSSVGTSGTGITAGAGDLTTGNVVTLTVNLSEAVTVNTTGGAPTLTLNDGGTATYTGGTGTSALTFSYTVAAGQNTADLAVTAINLNSATVADGAGNAANLTGAVTNPAGTLQIDTTTPTVSSVATSGTGITAGSGNLTTGSVVTLTVNLSEAVTVNTTGGTPTLTLNDGGTATYTGGTGTNALTFSYTVAAGQNTADLAVTAVNLNSATIKDGAGNAANLTGAVTNPAGTLQIDTTTPTVSSVATSGTGITAGSGDLTTGSVVTLTVNLSEAVTVNTTGGTPTLTLNDGGTATYTGGTGTNALTFSYTVAAGQNTADLAVTAVNLNSATIKDGAGNAANLTGAVTNPAGTLQIDTTTPTVSSVGTSGTGITAGAGDLTTGNVVTLTVNLSEAVTVNTTGGTPTLTLNDGGTATYTGGTGTNALTFSYTVAAGQNTADLAVTAVNLNSATIKDGAGNAANLTGAVTNPAGTLQIDTTTPTVSSVGTSGTGITAGAGDLTTGNVVTLTVNLSEAVTVNTTGGTPTLTLNDGGTATYTGGTGTNALTFSYTVAAGQNTADLAVTAINLNSATVTDGAGNAANLTGAVTNPVGTLQIDTTAPVISAIAESPSSGDLDAGKIVTYTISLSEAVTVNTAGGSPTLTFNDGGTGTYVGGSGTNALTFSYTVLPGQNTPDLVVSAVNLDGAAIQDSAGNAADLSLTGVAQGSPVIDTTPPTVASVTATAGDYNAGNTLTLTLNMSEAVNVTGTPTLTLNDGGSATYVGGSGTNALTFTYTVAAGQNTAGLAVTAVNGTIADLAGNALSSTGLPETFAGVTIDTTTPTVLSVATSGTGITAGAGDLTTGAVVTLTVNLSEAVTVDTTNGTPTLTLNDGGIATYTGGTGTSALTFSYTVAAGQNTADLAITAVNLNAATVTDGTGSAANLAGAVTNPAGTLQIDTTTPTVSSIADSPATGDFNAGKVITLTLGMSEVVTVNTTAGTPTLTLNDGGVATYVSGSGTNALTFSYTVVAGQNTPDLTVSTVNLNGATVQDGAGNAASLSLTGLTQGSPQIDTTTPVISAIVESPSSSDLNVGKTVTLTLDMSEVMTVNTTGGTPTLTLNDGGVATYVSGTGTNALTFSYTVAAGQNTAALKATALSLNGATITDGAGNAASLSVTGLTQTGPQIDTTTTLISAIVESPSSGDLNTGKTVMLTLDMSEVMTVNTTRGTPTLTLNDGGVATYVSGAGTNALTFSYTVAAGQNTAALKATVLSLNGATISDGAGNAANLSLTGLTQAGPQIDTTTPLISAIVESSSSGDLNAGKTVTLTLDMSEVMTVNTTGGTPTLTLNDGGVATYVSGTGTNALTFSYTVAAGQNTAALKATALNLNSATITDGAGNAASLSLSGLAQTGPQIDTTAPAAPLISYDKVIGNRALVVGTATAGSVVSIYEGTTLVGTTSSNSKGNWVFESSPLTKGTHTFTATATDAAGNVSTPSIAFDPDVGAGPVINAAAVEVGNQYYLYNSSGSDVALTYAGAIVTAGEFGGWTPIAAVQTATGYDVAWQMTGANEYTVWATDSSGNTIANLTGPVSGTSYALESLESTFNQDLNGDGVIGVPPTEIQVVANQYYLDGISGSGPALQLAGADVTVGEIAGWTAIGAVQTATGYDVAWKMTGANEYTVWATNSSGNAIANLTGPVSGTSYALESLESTFNQDLNGDGVIGLTTTVIQVDGSTSLTEVANRFYLDGTGGSGPALQLAGADVTAGEFGGWTPIGAVQTATGYDVAWKMAGANEYTVWATDSNGNTVANLTGPVSGTSTALESLESTFNQDLNGDGVIGLYAAPGTAMQINTAISGPATIGTGATLRLTGADSGSVTFASSKGTLVLDQSSTFSGQIIGFTGDGTLSGSDQIDMKDINFSTVQVSYTNGVLTVTDGVDTAKLNFSGSYVMANFSLASDGSGGTIVYDPPVSNFGPGSGTAADSDSPSGTDPAAFGSTAGADTPPVVDTPPADPTGFGSPPVTDPPAADPQNPVGFGSSVGTDTPAADPHNSIGLASAAVTDGASGGMHNSHGYGGSTVIDPPLAGAANQSNDSGSPAGFGSPPVPETPPVTLQNTTGFGSPPASDPPPVSPQNPTGFGFMPDPQNGTNGLSMPTFGAAATLGYFDNGIAEGTVLATNGSQGANIALLGNYMASSFPAPTGSLAGSTQGADGGPIGNSSSLLTHPQHA